MGYEYLSAALFYNDGNITLYAKLGKALYTPGDINDDGEVTSKDVTVLLRYLAKNYNITVQEAALDVNGDGDITSKDVTILQRYITGGYGVVLK